ncbi:permease [Desulfobacula sp.]|uniref:permease n=1 Tax=Desulfobacula sp. TaxID=2593537 RepID=UPI00261B39B5|nr:permease [Desulfobacula sp.]
MTNEIIRIANFMGSAFLHIWPYLVITIPIAVAVSMSGASKYIKRAFDAGPVTAILLATLVGAFSPFCSCGVIPVIAALLIGGVPLAPVMSFWIASPSMDPEIFFLSVGTIGWNLAVWRLVGTLILSLAAGFITHYLVLKNWLPTNVLKSTKGLSSQNKPSMIQNAWHGLLAETKNLFSFKSRKLVPAAACCSDNTTIVTQIQPLISYDTVLPQTEPNSHGIETESYGFEEKQNFWSRLMKESWVATLMVAKFMALAFFLEAIIILYVPQEWITSIMGQGNSWAIITAAFLGIPVYTSNLSALPMVSGLLTQGMSPAAALAFLIAGPTTTLPAMAAVWTLVKHRVFILYVSFALFGAIALGYLKLILG